MHLLHSLAIDLGSSNTRVFSTERGLILNEPSVVALNRNQKEVTAVGTEAREMIGRTPEEIHAVYPIAHGSVTDLVAMKAMFRYFLKSVHASSVPFLRPRLILCIPYDLTDMERRVLADIAVQAGFSENRTYLLEQSVATAVHAGIDINKPSGTMIVDVGGGITEVAIVSMGGIVNCSSVPTAGIAMNHQIMKYTAREADLLIGEYTAEQIKIRVADAYFDPYAAPEEILVKGRHAQSGLPMTASITSLQAAMAIRETVDTIVETVMGAMEHTPPELSADILHNGILLSGGTALLHGLDHVLEEKTGLRVTILDDPACAVVNGAALILKDLHHYQNALVPLRNLL